MKYTVFCSGSKGNCTLIETEKVKVLLDCGHTRRYLTQSFHNAGLHYNQVDAVLITHNHIDHVSQLKLFHDKPVFAPHVATTRPYPIKKRILSVNGHLSNTDSAQYLTQLIGLKTKSILLAHLSSEANTERHALETLIETFEASKVQIQPDLIIQCAKQNEPVTGGSQ